MFFEHILWYPYSSLSFSYNTCEVSYQVGRQNNQRIIRPTLCTITKQQTGFPTSLMSPVYVLGRKRGRTQELDAMSETVLKAENEEKPKLKVGFKRFGSSPSLLFPVYWRSNCQWCYLCGTAPFPCYAVCHGLGILCDLGVCVGILSVL